MELKNLSNHARGRWAEDFVQNKFHQSGWQTFSSRQKYKYGEIDFIFSKGQKKYLIEVKFLHNEWMSFERLQKSQIRKIQLNKIHLEKSDIRYTYKAFICFVTPTCKTKFIDFDEIIN